LGKSEGKFEGIQVVVAPSRRSRKLNSTGWMGMGRNEGKVGEEEDEEEEREKKQKKRRGAKISEESRRIGSSLFPSLLPSAMRL
jgi:hypothetical protein